MSILITAEELSTALAGPTPPVLLDVRWSLGGPPGHDSYLTGHLPGAVYVDLDTELARHGRPEDGRHPLPTVADLQRAARGWGIDDDSEVVVYDGAGNLSAARAWWLLRWAGFTSVRILDGALPAWRGPRETDDVKPEPGTVTFVGPDGGHGVLDVDDVEAFAAGPGVLLDARAPERYRGDSEPIDPKAGHIPAAVNAPTGENLDPDGRFLPADRLTERFARLGIGPDRPVAVYCGSGVTAAHEVAALAVAGFDAALYPGSWSQWSNQDRPVATGEQP